MKQENLNVGIEMKKFLVGMPQKLVEAIDELVEEGIYNSRSEFIRDVCRRYLKDNNLIEFNIKEEVE